MTRRVLVVLASVCVLTGAARTAQAQTTISGTVTSAANGQGVENVLVLAYNNNLLAQSATTNASGFYTIGGLNAATSYRLVTRVYNAAVPGLLEQVYSTNPTPIECGGCLISTSGGLPVTPGPTPRNFSLRTGAVRFTGTVTDANGNAVIGTTVTVFHSGTGPFTSGAAAFGVTDINGEYATGAAVPPGNYVVRTSTPANLGLVDVYADDVTCPGGVCSGISGRTFTITSASTAQTVNLTLKAGGTFSGTVVRDSDSVAQSGISISVTTASGTKVITSAISQPDGTFTSPVLPPGTYFASTFSSATFQAQVYNGIDCQNCPIGNGTPIVIPAAGNGPSDVNFRLKAAASIAGTITNGVTGQGGLSVQLFGVNTSQSLTQTTTAGGTGTYSFTGLTPGTYYVKAFGNASLSARMYSSGSPIDCFNCDPATGTPIVITAAGQAITGINVALPAGGTITGTIRDAGSNPLQGIVVILLAPNGNTVGTAVLTAADGTYSFTGLAPGGYYVRASGTPNVNYISQAWGGGGSQNRVCVTCTVSNVGAPINLALGATVPGIDFNLSPGGSFSGTVTGPGGPVPGVTIQSVDVANIGSTGNLTTAGDGTYKVFGLPPGTYFARTTNSVGLIDEAFDDIPCFGCSAFNTTPIVVTGTSDTSGRNFSLASSGRISGRVTDTYGLPLGFTSVQIYNASNALAASANTDNGGNYTTGASLAPGSYFAVTNSTAGYVNLVYNGASGLACVNCGTVANTGTPVVVTTGNTTSGINFALPVGGRITGLVTNNGLPIANVAVQAWIVAGTSKLQVASGTSSSLGTYAINGLPAGTYFVRTANSIGLTDRLFNSAAACVGCDVASGQPVVVTAGGTTSAVDFALGDGGSLVGTVTDASTGLGLGNVQVNVYATSGGSALTTVRTTVDGTYFLRGLAPGSYRVATTASNSFGGGQFVNQVFDASTPINCMICDVTAGSIVTIVAGAPTIVNVALIKGETITGMVTDSVTAAGIPGVTINIFTSTGASLSGVIATVITDASGNYRIPGLLPTSGQQNRYLLRTSNGQGYIDQLHQGIDCLNCVATGGTPVSVSAGVNTVNFALTKGGRIAGTVTDSGGNPLSGISVQFYRNGSLVGSTTTNVLGRYASSGLPPSDAANRYTVKTFNSAGFVDKLYDNITCSSCATTSGAAVAVTAGGTTDNINFTLIAGGTITGTVTAAPAGGGGPLSGITVSVSFADSGSSAGTATTNASGVYTVKGLDPGPSGNPTKYVLRTSNSQGFINGLYDGKECQACTVTGGTQVAVSTSTPTTGINFVLRKGGTIKGTVQGGGVALPGATVQVNTLTGAFVASTVTAPDGSYQISGLVPAASYLVRTTGSHGFVNQVHAGISCQLCTSTSGTPVAVDGTTPTFVNFNLAAGGAIVGSVKDGTTANLSGITVSVVTTAGSTMGSATTGAAGTFRIAGLPSGSYTVKTSNTQGFIDQQYDGVTCVSCPPSTGTPVAVSAPGDSSPVDFVLTRGGSIAGRVTDFTGGAGIGGVTVQIFNSTDLLITTTTTDAQGNYVTRSGLPDGRYYARTQNSLGYINVIHPSSTCLNCSVRVGDPITITAAAAVTGINFSLKQGGRISGLVTDAVTSLPLAGVSITIYLRDGTAVGGVGTNGAGTYASQGLPTGDYFAKTNNGLGYVNRLYNAKDCLRCAVGSGTPIHVDEGATTTGVNFALNPGLRIGGRITDTSNNPVAGVSVTIVDASGFPVGGSAVSNANGDYITVTGLTAGRYYARTNNQIGYVNQLYSGFGCLACSVVTGTPIDLTTANRTDINFSLAQGGRISGTVSGGGQPLQDAFVGVFSSGGTYLTSAGTGTSGLYVVGEGLPSGKYFLVTRNDSGFIEQLYDAKNCPSILVSGAVIGCAVTSGTAVDVTAGATTTGKNFNLTAGGRIKGRITDAATGDPIATLQINIYDASGIWVAGAFTDGSGNYITASGLPTGSYFVLTQSFNRLNPYVNKLYTTAGGVACPGCNVTLVGSPVAVSAPATTPDINMALERGHIISGRVTDSTGTPISGATVRFFNSAGVSVTRGTTDENGEYSTVSGLPAGAGGAVENYFARTVNGLGFVDRLYDTGNCLACDVTRGTPIPVSGPGTTAGINFTLPSGARIAGTVTAASNGATVAGAKVRVFNESGAFVAETETNGVGAYTTPGLPPALAYYVRTVNSSGLIDELYNDLKCPPCSPTAGAPIALPTITVKSGINFALDGGGLLSGFVKDQDRGTPIQGAVVAIYLPGGTTPIAYSTPTDANGYYAISLPVGSYEVEPLPMPGFRTAVVLGLRTVTRGSAAARSSVSVDTGTETTGVGFALKACSALTVSPATLSLATFGQLYSKTLTATGGTGPYTFVLSDGAPTPGLGLTSAGVLTGVPAATGTAAFTAAAVDANGCAGSVSYALFTCAVSLTVPSAGVTAASGSGSVAFLATASDCPWTVTANVPWITITSAASGTGASTVTYSYQNNPSPNTPRTGTITIGGQTYTVVQASNTTLQPFGVVDTPVNGSVNVAGAIAVTGWALDDVSIARVIISRGRVESEGAGDPIFIGDGVFVTGARPDVAATFPALPNSNRAGWGYLLLTNVLPPQGGATAAGNGTYVLHVDFVDAEGNVVRGGDRTITVSNSAATKPFGTIDTPGQGQTVSGAFFNFGWMLTPLPKTMPKDGSTMKVYIDGIELGNVDYNHFRADIASTFPGLNNTGDATSGEGGSGNRLIDTTQFTDGVHTIGWFGIDDQGAADGVGSRYFRILNGSGLRAAPNSTRSAVSTMTGALAHGSAEREGGSQAASLLSAAPEAGRIWASIGADRGREFTPNGAGVFELTLGSLERMEVRFGAAQGCVAKVAGGMVQRDGSIGGLPVGSALRAGALYWQPGPAFYGIYDLEFTVTSCNGSAGVTRLSVQVVPKR